MIASVSVFNPDTLAPADEPASRVTSPGLLQLVQRCATNVEGGWM
jgi:hypothetical protein